MDAETSFPDAREQAVIVKALIVFRLAAISFFFGTVVIFQIQFPDFIFPIPLSALIGLTYLLNIVYLFTLGRIRSFVPFLYFQLAADLIIETGIIYHTGGVASPFTFLYMLTVISSVIIMQPGGSYVLASGASILYGLLVTLEFYGVLHPLPLYGAEKRIFPTQEYVFFAVLIHIAAFYLVAFLSDFLSRRLSRTLLALGTKSRDLTYLQAFHQNVVANMGSGFIALDLDGRIISANPAAEMILGMRAADFLKKTLREVFPALEYHDALPETEQPKKTEWLHEAGGEKKILAATSSFFRNSTGEILGVIIIFHDITHFKKMEDAMAKSERLAAVGRMAAGLAHEIRNPLGSISGSIQMMKSAMEHELKPPHDRLMAITLRETDRLNGIIGRFLSYAQPNTRKLPDVHLASLIADAVMLFKNDHRYSGAVRVTTALDGRIRLTCDPESLKQVLWNLLLNAAQAMPDGGDIVIGAALPAGPGGEAGECVITVTDNGTGMDETEAARIFEPFYTTKEGGTGLGLSMVQKIIEDHNGSVFVQSKKGEGSAFSIRLPASSTPPTPQP
ncbi:MAG: PAS domain S-box protein [Nitrospinae bacterium]|nr:PAS domain S-box protein [Nitrospinota bacterium]